MKAIIKKYLKINNYDKKQNDFENLFLSHPNYPSLFAITDTLDMLSIENVAAKVPKEQFPELPNSFLAVFNDDITLVTKQNNEIAVEKEKEGKKKVSTDDFLNKWNGVVIAIEQGVKLERKRLSLFKSKYVLLVLILFSLFVIKMEQMNGLISIFNFGIIVIGVLISVLIVDEKLNTLDGAISKICSFSEKTSCDSVIKSKNAKITKWLDFSDLPILFFSVSALLIVIDESNLKLINFLSVLSLPIILYSIWLQQSKLKKWCVLCLGISSLLIMQAALFFIVNQPLTWNLLSITNVLLVMVPIWFFWKPILFKRVELQKKNIELIKFKRNYTVFKSLQKEIVNEQRLKTLTKVEIGNKNASVNLTLILSPSCSFCHTAFENGLELVNSSLNKVRLTVFFNLNPDNKDNPYLSIVESILQINENMPEKIVEAISDWHIKKMSLEDWKEKWEQKKKDSNIVQIIREQYEWCSDNNFNYTPVKLLNSKLFPGEYDIEEVKYFISELEEELQPILV